jgi:ABC-type sugar transport system permease subunit
VTATTRSEERVRWLARLGIRARRSWLGPREPWWGLLFVLPILILFIVFKFLPILRAGYLSFTEYNPLDRIETFVGIENYVGLAGDAQFLNSLRVTLTYVIGTVTPLVVISLGLAILLNQKIRLRGVFRALIFLPAVIPIIVVPILWRFMYHPFGLVNTGFDLFGFEGVNWLQSKDAVIPGFIIASEWRFVPLFMIIYLAGLQAIPEDLYDAAKVDGASAVQRFRHVTIPMLKPTILVVVVVAVTFTAKTLVLALVMTNGGPDNASRTLSLFIYEMGFRFFRLGYASAASMILLALIVVFTLINMRVFRTDD